MSLMSAALAIGPQQEFAEEIHSIKYRGDGESFREGTNRLANALQDNRHHYEMTRDIWLYQRHMPGGRIQSAMGSLKNTAAHNCFVSGTILDSFVDGEGNIMQRATEAAATMRMGGGIGYDFSPLRPRGALIKKLMSQSSGPVEFMKIFYAICECVASSGHRRGAQMGVLRVDHPDIEAFIHAKQNTHAFLGFNFSIGITDHFMKCVKEDLMFPLVFEGTVHREVSARNLWDMIMRSTYDWGEPGVLFIDRINAWNNLHWLEYIAATNPCGEQPLPPYGACLLGSYNLIKYIIHDGSKFKLNLDLLKRDIPHVVRSMDNVIDRTLYPLKEQRLEAISKRRMGMGVTALANTIETCGNGDPAYLYGEDGFLEMEDQILTVLRDTSYKASVELAKEKGAFPLFDADKYAEGKFIQTLPEELQDEIHTHGIRNSHSLSIAPTGTISLTGDNVSSGIEPVYKYKYDRMVNFFDGPKTYTVNDPAHRMFGTKGRLSAEVTVKQHLDVLAIAQSRVDSAVSKTCNIPTEYDWQDFQQVYMGAFDRDCKGCTTYRVGGKRESILSETDETPLESEKVGVCFIDPVTGQKECE